MNITIWNEGLADKNRADVKAVYPEGLHGALAEAARGVKGVGLVRTATLDDPECGLPDDVLNTTDVLMWWGHQAHHKVPDELVTKIHERVLRGMGLIALHSAHYSKIFRKLMGTSCGLRWREDTYERVFCVNPSHPIAAGIPMHFELGKDETYAEFFDIPAPDETVFLGWFDIGEVFRSGCVWRRGYGKVFYFQPGHETNPTYYNEYVKKIIQNACVYLAPTVWRDVLDSPKIETTLEEIRAKSGGK